MADPKKYRLNDEQDALVREISSASRGVLKEVDVVRLAIDALGDYWRHHKGRLMVPLDYRESFTVIAAPLAPQPMILHEPPSRVRPELVRPVEHSKMKTGSR
jgi:hypothetical protein